MKKILFYTSGVGLGGVERVILELLKGIKGYNNKIFLGLQYGNEDQFVSEIPGYVTYRFMLPKPFIDKILRFSKLKKKKIFYRLYHSFLRVKEKNIINSEFFKNYKEMDIAIDFKSGDFLKKIIKLKGKKICWFHTSLNKSSAYKKSPEKLLERLKKIDKIIVICEEMKKEFIAAFPQLKDKVTVIYNPLNVTLIKSKSLNTEDLSQYEKSLLRNRFILAVTRFETTSKDLNTLIRSFDLIKDSTDHMLYIAGDGPDRNEVEALIKDLNLEDRIILLGIQKNPYIWMKRADLFLHSSKFEGFGMVLAEAMACETPVISTDCPVGPREILLDGKCGILVPVGDYKAMAHKTIDLLKNPKLQEEFILHSNERIIDFSIDRVSLQVIQMLNSIS